MTAIEFIEGAPDPQKGFRMGRPQSLLQPNVTFTITGVKYGNYQITEDDGSITKTKFADKAQSILLTTDIGEDIPLTRLLKNRRVIYDSTGRAFAVESCNFRGPLLAHMEQLGRRAEDKTMLNGTVQEVGTHVKKFFDGKTLRVVEFEGFDRDSRGKLVSLLSPCIQLQFVTAE